MFVMLKAEVVTLLKLSIGYFSINNFNGNVNEMCTIKLFVLTFLKPIFQSTAEQACGIA